MAQQSPSLLYICQDGFLLWEVDISYYALSWLSLFGIVWDMKKPSQRVLETARI